MSLETYGRYQLLKKLATGGMAQIYLARQRGPEGFEKLLVVKRILPHLAENAEFITMFLDEARIAARLNHPNVVQIFDLGAQDDSYFIAMEYIHGEDARRVWKQAERQGQPIPTALICRIIIEACAGLDYAHKKADATGRPLNIVHRDVSPQNILVSFEGGVKIVDFGIAKAADQATVTKSGVLKGKYSYMSPEQAAGQPIDCRTDVFAVGVVLYELLTGTRLFKRANDVLTLAAVSDCLVQPPSEIDSRLPKALDAIVLKALAKDRTQRFAEAKALGAALEEWLLAQRLSSSSAQLAEFLQGIYAERLAKEQEEGRLMIETADASLAPETGGREKGTPSQEARAKATVSLPTTARPSRGSRDSGVRPEVSATEVTAPARPTNRPESQRRLSPARPAPRVTDDPVGTQSLPTQSDRARRPGLLIGLGVAGLALVGALVAWWLTGAGPARVELTSLPSGAVVKEGGQELCRTPCELTSLGEGVHTLEFEAVGRERSVVEVMVPAAGTLSVPPVSLSPSPVPEVITPRPAQVRLAVDSEPTGASVRLGPEAVGVTPWQREVEVGFQAELTVEKEGHRPYVERFTVGNGPEEHHLITLVPEPPVAPVKPVQKPPRHDPPEAKGTGTVRFAVKPWAKVECGSYRFGETPFSDQEMAVGEYRCTFTNPELGQKSQLVKVQANQLTKVRVEF